MASGVPPTESSVATAFVSTPKFSFRDGSASILFDLRISEDHDSER